MEVYNGIAPEECILATNDNMSSRGKKEEEKVKEEEEAEEEEGPFAIVRSLPVAELLLKVGSHRSRAANYAGATTTI